MMRAKTDLTNTNEFEILQKCLLASFRNTLELANIQRRLISTHVKESICGLSDTTKSLIIAFLTSKIQQPTLVITSSIANALKLKHELSLFTTLPVMYFPSLESSPYDMAFSPANSVKEQLDSVEYLINKQPCIIIINAKTLINTFLDKQDYLNYSVKINVEDELDLQDITKTLINIGYNRVPMVMDPGEFTIRGDICDIYPISSKPVRVEFAFDEVESIRYFNINTQRSIENIRSIIVRPRYKAVLTDDSKYSFIDHLKTQLDKTKKELDKDLYNALEEAVNNIITQLEEFNYFEGIEYFAPYLHKNLASLPDYLPEGSSVFFDELYEIENQLINQKKRLDIEYHKGNKSGSLLPIPYLLHNEPWEILSKLQQRSNIFLNTLQSIEDDTIESFEVVDSFIPSFMGNLKNAAEYIKDLKQQDYNVVITTEYPQRVKSVFSEWSCHAIYLSEETSDIASVDDIIITKVGFTTSFLLPDYKIAGITDKELFGKRSKKPTISKHLSKRENLDFFLSPSDLQENDYVVHARHGIGKFVKLQKMTIDNQQRDYLTIEYFKGDKLYVPVDQINLLTRYRGSGDKPPKLSKMGGADWENIKRKAKNAVESIAVDLLNH